MHKFPFYLQYDSLQCGIACLQMICKYFGREYTIDSLSNLCLFLDAYCVGKHQILRKSSKFLEFLLASYGVFRKISYLYPRIKAFFAYSKIQKRAEVRSFPYCYLYYKGKHPTS